MSTILVPGEIAHTNEPDNTEQSQFVTNFGCTTNHKQVDSWVSFLPIRDLRSMHCSTTCALEEEESCPAQHAVEEEEAAVGGGAAVSTQGAVCDERRGGATSAQGAVCGGRHGLHAGGACAQGAIRGSRHRRPSELGGRRSQSAAQCNLLTCV
jgi:hypothetical protein